MLLVVLHNIKKRCHMANIPGWVYIIIGMVVSIASYTISYDKMLFFFYLGFIFIGVGFAKLAFAKVFPNLKTEDNFKQGIRATTLARHQATRAQNQRPSALHRYEPQMQQTQYAAQHNQTQHHAQHQAAQARHTQSLTCASCGTRLHPSFTFCPRCGQKLR
jgi:ribosomal protein L40E